MNFVLVHGAWLGAWCWDAVAENLRKHGHTVAVPDLPGHGNDHTPLSQVSFDSYVKKVIGKKAKKLVRQLVSDLGFDPVDAGPLSQSHALEVLASLWGGLAYGQQMGRGIAFRLLRR